MTMFEVRRSSDLPNGMICEVFTRAALAAGARAAAAAYDREHVTPICADTPSGLALACITWRAEICRAIACASTRPRISRWSNGCATALAPVGDCFTLNDVIACLADHLDWRALNAEVPRAAEAFSALTAAIPIESGHPGL